MEGLKPPEPMIVEGNLAEKWKEWKQDFTLYLDATEAASKTDRIKSSILLHCIGKAAKEIYSTFTFDSDEDKLKYEEVIKRFEEYFTPKKNLTFLRYTFLTARQKEGELFDEFVTRLKKLSEDCDFGTLRDSLIKDLVIIGLRDKKLQERLLRETDITLDKVIAAGRANEATRIQAKTIQGHGHDKSIDEVNKDVHYQREMINQCKYCGGSHPKGDCPAYFKYCGRCNKRGHFSRCCTNNNKDNTRNIRKENDRSKVAASTSRFNNQRKKKVDQVHKDEEDNSQSDSDDEYFIPIIQCDGVETEGDKSDWYIDLDSNGTEIRYKLDTGAQANVLPLHEFKRISNKPPLKKTDSKLTAYNGTSIDVAGKCIIRVKCRNKLFPVLFIVADTKSTPIIGLQTCTRLNLIQRIFKIDDDSYPSFLNEFEGCFGEVGTLPKEHHIVTDPKIPPVVDAARKVPHKLREDLQKELKRMADLGIIAPIREPTDWVSSIVVVSRPNGKMRVCLDPRNLNKAIKRHHHKLPTTEEILAQMSGGKLFTKLDASNAYWQMKLDDESSKLLTFNTPFGRYRFLRMPFGIHSASEICQVAIAEIIEGLDGAINCQDDIIIWGSTKDELEKRTIAVLKSVRESGLKLRKAKCQFNMEELTYLGHKISSKGIEVDPTKVKAVIDMPYPTTKKELLRFLGMVNYLGKFLPNLSNETAPLRQLLGKDIEWSFDKPQKEAVDKLKGLITNTPVLNFYNPNLPIKVSSDASQNGLGAVIEQLHGEQWHPIAFASRTLQPYERNYSQIEKETLSIVCACEAFSEYLFGQQFIMCNDHLPLKAIFNKPFAKAPMRIQRFLLRLQRYSFEMEYVKGSLLFVADTLSRASLPDDISEIPEEDLNSYIHSVVLGLPISESKFEEFRRETENDAVLKKLYQQIGSEWPTKRKEVDPELRTYFNIRDDLTTYNGVILKGNRIVVPTSMRKEMKKLLHTAHVGKDRIKNRARETLYWPGISSELDDLISACALCQEFRNKQPSETLLHHEIPSTPWTKVGTDVFHLFNKPYIMVVDYSTNFFDISQMPNAESPTVVQHTKSIFAKYGIPKEIFSDNGPEFIAKEYKSFCKAWDIYHDTSSPEYPQSNGLVERTIETVKKTLRKVKLAGEDRHLALLALKTTPGNKGQPSSAEMFFNRQPRSVVPSMVPYDDNLKGVKKPYVPCNPVHRKLPNLQPGDSVRIRKGKSWSRRGKVVGRSTQPRSYNIETEQGNTLRRNRKHIIKTSEKQFDIDSDSECSLVEDNLPIADRIPRPQQLPGGHPDNVINEEPIINDDEAEDSISTRTRYGRNVRLPDRYADYDMS